MAMKVAKQEDPPIQELPPWELISLLPLGERPVPPSDTHKLRGLFNAHMQKSFLEAALTNLSCVYKAEPEKPVQAEKKAQVSLIHSQPKAKEKVSSKEKQASPVVVPVAPPPAEAPRKEAEIIQFPVSEVSKERISRTQKKKRGGGDGGCQDLRPDLKAWLGAWCPIPNNVCMLEDKERHKAATERSQKVRLAKYGDKEYRPTLPEWVPVRQTIGWPGGRPPTLEQLYSTSRLTANRLGEYQVDAETRDFILNNLGRSIVAPPFNDPDDLALECSKSLADYQEYCTGFNYLIFGIDMKRRVKITPELLGNVHLTPKAEEAAKVSNPVAPLEPLESKCTTCTVRRDAEPVTLLQWTFKEERLQAQRRAAPWAISFKELRSPDWGGIPLALPKEVDEDAELNSELKMYFSLVNDGADEGEDERVHSATLMSLEEKIRYTRFLLKSGKRNVDLSDMPYRQRTFFDCPQWTGKDDRNVYNNWLSEMEKFSPPRPSCLYDEWWEKRFRCDDEARLEYWYRTHQNYGPDIERRVVACEGDMRWNNFVKKYESALKGRITLDQAYNYAKGIQRMYWKRKEEAGEACRATAREREMQEWAKLMEYGTPLKEGDPDWIIDPKEINELNEQVPQGAGEPLIPHHDDIVARITRKRVRHLALKRGWKGLMKHVREMFTAEEQRIIEGEFSVIDTEDAGGKRKVG